MAKGILIVVIIATIGILVLPSTISLFQGSHLWYNLSGGYGEKCLKCHADIYDEMTQSSYHDTVDGSSGVSGRECYVCHRANVSIVYANATTGQPGQEAHAASTIQCGYCHFNSSNPFNAPVAGGFGKSDLASDSGSEAAHLSFLQGAINSTLGYGENEACIACHTPVGVKFNITVPTQFNITARNSISGSSSYWNITAITLEDTITYTEIKNP